MARRGFLLLFFALALAAASAASAFLLSIAASRQPTPTPTAGPTPTPEPRNGAKSLQQQQQQPLPTTTTTTTKSSLGSSSSCRAAAAAATTTTKTTTTSPPPPLVPLFASAPAWQRGARPRLKVLAVPLVSGRSHLFVMHAVAAELAARGHEVKVKKILIFFEFFFLCFFREKKTARARGETLSFFFSAFSISPAFSLPLSSRCSLSTPPKTFEISLLTRVFGPQKNRKKKTK